MKLTITPHCCGCSYCYRTCPVGAPYFDGEQTQIDVAKCIGCGQCVKACPMGAIYDTENPPKPMPKHEKKSYSCDALIIGAGATGMTAAVRLAEQGKKVIVLEKEKNTGSGAMHVAGPMQIVDTKWALDAGEAPKLPQKIAEAKAYGAGYLDPELIENTLTALPRFFDWMCTFTDMSEGFALTQARPMPPMPQPKLPEDIEVPEGVQESVIAGGGMPGSAMGGNLGLVTEAKSYAPDSPGFHNAGEFIMKRLLPQAEKLGVSILRETTAYKLLRASDGSVTGVLARDPGGEVELSCKVCLIATGSLLLSDAVKKIEPDFANAYQPRYGHTIPSYTGDGFEMCREAGIPVRYEDIWLNITGSLVMPCDGLTVEYAQAAHKKPMMPPDLRGQANRPESLMVNLNGERYQNEQMACISVRAQMKQPKGLSYALFTDELIRSQPQPWIPIQGKNGKLLRTMLPVGMPNPPWNEEHMQWLTKLKGKHLVIADSLEELAEQLGMNPDTLCGTVSRYNSLCAAGKDDDFGKHPFYLHALEHGPYYAVRTFLMSDGAEGGIPIDANCRVMDHTGAIPNLFAGGDNSSGNIVLTEDKEKRWITNEFSWALSSGMIAADSMLKELAAH